MTEHTERTTESVLGTEPRHGAPAVGAPEQAPLGTQDRAAGTAAAHLRTDRTGDRERTAGGPDGQPVPPAPHTAPDGHAAPAAPRTASEDHTVPPVPRRSPEDHGAAASAPHTGTGTEDHSVPPAPRTAPANGHTERTGRPEAAGADRPLVAREHRDELSQRMQHAVTDFVESPRRAVEEAESTFDQIVSGLTEALAERKRVLRASWHDHDTEAQTEELRVALQHYRDLSEQLLKI